MNIYDFCSTFENDDYLLRSTVMDDCDDLLAVYSDKNALPFFNSDNCNGDNFFYNTKEKMKKAIDFWEMSYRNRYFARLTIIDKSSARAIGTIELCLRVSDDAFNNMAVLRVDLRSDCERENVIYSVVSLISPHICKLLDSDGIITKVPLYAVERLEAIKKAGFERSEHLLIGHDGYAYNGYWIK